MIKTNWIFIFNGSLFAVSGIIIILSFFWVISDRAFEPMIVFLGFCGTAIVSLRNIYINHSTRITKENIIPKKFSRSSPIIKDTIRDLYNPAKNIIAIETLRNTNDKDGIEVLAWSLDVAQFEPIHEKIASTLAEKTAYKDARPIPILINLPNNPTQEQLESRLPILAQLFQNVPKENIPNLDNHISTLTHLMGKDYSNEGIRQLRNPSFEHNTSYGIQAFIEQILINIFPVESLPVLISILKQKNNLLERVTITETLKKLASKSRTNKAIPIRTAIPELISGLSNGHKIFIQTIYGNYSMRDLAIEALIEIGEEEELIVALKQNPISEQRLIIEILKRIGTKKALNAVERWQNQQSNNS